MKRFSTLMRGSALALILTAAAGIVASNMTDVSVVAADYMVRADLDVPAQVESATAEAEVATLTDWEYTLRGRPVKCFFFTP